MRVHPPVTHRGLTLLELLVVLAILGVLATLAYPTYVDHVMKARMADAQMVMLEAAQWMEMERVKTNSFPSAAVFASDSSLAYSPKASAKQYYQLRVAPRVGTQGYVVTATPAQGQQWRSCSSLTLDDRGVKSPLDCWP